MKTIELSGQVGGPDFNQVQLQRLLDDAAGTQIQVVIASHGGCSATGLLVAALLRDCSDVSIVIKFAGSAAVAPALAASRRAILAGGSLLFHRAWHCAVGTCEDLGLTSKRLRDLDLVDAKIYAQASGQPVEFILELMSRSAVLDANQALEMGFVHSIVDAPGGRIIPDEVWHRTATGVARKALRNRRDRNPETVRRDAELFCQAVQLADYPPESKQYRGYKPAALTKLLQRETEQIARVERRLHRFANGLSPDPRIPRRMYPLNSTWRCECGAVNYHPPGHDGQATICNTCLP